MSYNTLVINGTIQFYLVGNIHTQHNIKYCDDGDNNDATTTTKIQYQMDTLVIFL